jgi:hypothetical protein
MNTSMEAIRTAKRTVAISGLVIHLLLFPMYALPATIDEIVFLNRVQEYETIASTTLVTQEGKRIPVPKGTRLNIAGFTRDDAFVISRTDRPNGFVRKEDIAPLRPSSRAGEGPIREETLE